MPHVDLRPLLTRDAWGDALVVFGVRCGDAAARLGDAPLTDADGGDETATARIARALAGDGWVRGEGVAFRVEGGRVSRIFVRDAALSSLGVSVLADIERRFGPAEGIERSFGTIVHHYPSRALAVTWSVRAQRLDHVALGPDPWSEPRYGGKELLLELVGHWHDLKTAGWREPAAGSVRIRHQRVAALARAFGLGTVEDVARGRFVDRAGERYLPLLGEIAARGPAPEGRATLPESVYVHLLHYRVDAARVLDATKGCLECSDPALLGMIATQDQIADKLRAELAQVDAWLAAFLDPGARAIPESELIARWGFPDVDVRDLEMDEL